MSSEKGNSFHDRAEMEIDLRLLDVLLDALTVDSWTAKVVAGYLRLAYAAGYQQALEERKRGQLFRDLGLAVPKRAD